MLSLDDAAFAFLLLPRQGGVLLLPCTVSPKNSDVSTVWVGGGLGVNVPADAVADGKVAAVIERADRRDGTLTAGIPDAIAVHCTISVPLADAVGKLADAAEEFKAKKRWMDRGTFLEYYPF